MRPMLLAGLLALVGSTFACAATPAPEPFEGDPTSSSARSTKKSSPKSEATPAPSSTGDVADRPPPVDADPPAPAPPVQASDTTWTGTLARTDTAKFGGSPYCDYQTHFENLTVKVVIGSDGKVKSADVAGQAVEEALNGCPNPPIAPNQHDYALTTEATGTSFSVDGGGAAAQPHAKLDAEVSAAGTTGTITVKIQRNDIGAPLVWTINAKVPLTKQ
jgi:hypothetical protein